MTKITENLVKNYHRILSRNFSPQDSEMARLRKSMWQHVTNYSFSNQDYFNRKDRNSPSFLPRFDPRTVAYQVAREKAGLCMELNYAYSCFLTKHQIENRLVKCHKPNPKFPTDKSATDYYDIFHLGIIAFARQRPYFVDVGFGEFFIRPLFLADGEQANGLRVSRDHGRPLEEGGIQLYKHNFDNTPKKEVLRLGATATMADIQKNYHKFMLAKAEDFPLCKQLYERICDPYSHTYVDPKDLK